MHRTFAGHTTQIGFNFRGCARTSTREKGEQQIDRESTFIWRFRRRRRCRCRCCCSCVAHLPQLVEGNRHNLQRQAEVMEEGIRFCPLEERHQLWVLGEEPRVQVRQELRVQARRLEERRPGFSHLRIRRGSYGS